MCGGRSVGDSTPFVWFAWRRIGVTPRSQNGPEALPGALPHHYGLPWETVEVLAEALETEKRRPESGRTLQKRQI